MKITIGKMSIWVLILFFGGIFATIATDLWTTTTTKVPVKYSEGDAAGSYNPEDIRGSYTFAEVSELFEVELAVLYEAFGIDLDTDGTEIQTKDLEGMYEALPFEVGNESVQVFVALYKDLPITLTETYLPVQAIEILKGLDREWTAEELDYFDQYSIEIVQGETEEPTVEEPAVTAEESIEPAVEPEPAVEASEEPAKVTEEIVKTEEEPAKTGEAAVSEKSSEEEETNLVNGSATFQQVLDGGITQEQIESIIGDTMPPTNQTVKDYCTQNNLSFSQIKDEINALVQ